MLETAKRGRNGTSLCAIELWHFHVVGAITSPFSSYISPLKIHAAVVFDLLLSPHFTCEIQLLRFHAERQLWRCVFWKMNWPSLARVCAAWFPGTCRKASHSRYVFWKLHRSVQVLFWSFEIEVLILLRKYSLFNFQVYRNRCRK